MMGPISMNLPAISVPAGPMLRGNWRGEILGSGSDVSKYWAERRAGNIDLQAWTQIEDGIARSAGTCMTMGTASTMTSVAEALGFSLPGASAIPAVDSNHAKMANRSGRRIVEMVWEDLKPRDILRDASFNNAIAAVFEGSVARSEEHTSELQSRLHLVCRLLLEKKKKKDQSNEWRHMT